MTCLISEFEDETADSLVFRRHAIREIFDEIKRISSIRTIVFCFDSSGSTDFCDVTSDFSLIPPETLLTSVDTVHFEKHLGGTFDRKSIVSSMGNVFEIARLMTF